MIRRSIERSILRDFTRKKVIVLLGARQVGKTTLLEGLHNKKEKVLSINCDDLDDTLLIEEKTSTELRALLAPYDMVFIDEAQRVKNIGLTLKKIGDLKLDTKVIVTGSSSLELAGEVNEPATGRLIEYHLFPFSLAELAAETSEREEQRMLEQRLI
ncbi:MAG: AAA family ATPase, partial [Bacteroidaceae bacterium]|nr:AAA family ATPase [Bacteroidaceae bacterium]